MMMQRNVRPPERAAMFVETIAVWSLDVAKYKVLDSRHFLAKYLAIWPQARYG